MRAILNTLFVCAIFSVAHGSVAGATTKALVSGGVQRAPELTRGAAVCNAAYTCWDKGVFSCACATQAGAAAVANSVPYPLSIGVVSGATLYAPEIEGVCEVTADRLKLPVLAVAAGGLWNRFKDRMFPEPTTQAQDTANTGSTGNDEFMERKWQECEERNAELHDEMRGVKTQLKELTDIINKFVANRIDTANAAAADGNSVTSALGGILRSSISAAAARPSRLI